MVAVCECKIGYANRGHLSALAYLPPSLICIPVSGNAVCGYEVTEKVAKVVPAATTAAETTAPEAKGCGGTVIGSSAVLVAVIGVGAVCMKKKKED